MTHSNQDENEGADFELSNIADPFSDLFQIGQASTGLIY